MEEESLKRKIAIADIAIDHCENKGSCRLFNEVSERKNAFCGLRTDRWVAASFHHLTVRLELSFQSL